MRISLGLVTGMPLQQGIRLASFADDLGCHRCFIGEDIMSREIFTYLSVIALRTRRIKLATGIASPYVRNLAVLASGALSIQRISDGRFDLGLGPGGLPEVERFTGEAPRHPVRALREAVDVIKRLLSGERVTYSGLDGKKGLRDFVLHGAKVRVPRIYFGVRGRKLLSLAGEISDGVIFSGPKDRVRSALGRVEGAAMHHGRRADAVERILWLPLFEGMESDTVQLARRVVATIISSMPKSETAKIPASEEITRHVLRGDYQGAASFVAEDTIKQFCIIGTIEEIADEVRGLERGGFEELVIGPPFGREPEGTLRRLWDRLGWA